jgi:putative heme-binding domain-containing protein
VTNRTAAESVRLQAAELLGQTTFAESGQLLLGLLSPAQPQSVQLAAIEALGRFADPRVATGLIKGWAAFTPRLREEAMRALLARPDRALVLLQAFEQGVVRRADLNSTQVQFLTGHREPSVKALATQLLLTAAASPRQEVVESFRPALLLEGDAARGREVFMQRCVSCHRLGGEGFAVGPDLVSVRNAGKDKLLVSILDPGRELLPQFIAYEIETRDGESVLGFIIEETAANLTVRQAYAKETVLPRATILRMNSSGRSIMPDELEAGLTPQAFADLLEFVMTAAK